MHCRSCVHARRGECPRRAAEKGVVRGSTSLPHLEHEVLEKHVVQRAIVPAQLKTRGPSLVQADPLLHALGTWVRGEPARGEHRGAGAVRWTSGRGSVVRRCTTALRPPDLLGWRSSGGPLGRTAANENIPTVGRRGIRPSTVAEFFGGPTTTARAPLIATRRRRRVRRLEPPNPASGPAHPQTATALHPPGRRELHDQIREAVQ
jgi:hypothetical protein